MIIYTYLSQQQIWHKKLFSERRRKQQSCQNTSKDLSFYPINCGVNEFCISYLTAESVSYYSLYSVTISKSMVYPQISTTEETFQYQLINTTIFQTKSLMFCLNLHCLFPVPHVQLILLRCQVNQKRLSNKNLKIFVSFK